MTPDIDRRDFLKKGLRYAGAASALSPLALGTRARAAAKPNLLFLWTDEQRFDTMAAYGNTVIKTPALNRLAEDSVVFEKAYVTQPVCTPARSSVMTGLWPHQNGCTRNNVPLRADTKCLPELLGDPDYACAYMGKWHLGDEIFAQHGFDTWVGIEDGYGRYYSDRKTRDRRSGYHHFLVEKGYRPDGGGRFSRSFAARRPIEHCKPKFLELNACDFLRANRANPFILYVNFLEPHMPFFGPLDDLHDPAEIGLPGNFSDPLEANEPLRYRLARENCRDSYGRTEAEFRRLIAKYHGLVSQVDRSVGGILDTLDELGLREDTIVVFTSDHGDMMGSHGLVAKQFMYEESARVPLLMRIPRLRTGRRVVRQPVSHIDLVPTLLDLMGAGAGRGLPGQSLAPLIRGGEGGTVREDHVFIEWNPNKIKYRKGTRLATKEEIERIGNEKTRAVVSPDGWKLCLSDLDRCQLFNLKDDPLETTNLYDSGRHVDVIDRLRSRILAWQESVGDAANVKLPGPRR